MKNESTNNFVTPHPPPESFTLSLLAQTQKQQHYLLCAYNSKVEGQSIITI